MLPRAHEVYRRLLDRCDQRRRLLAKLHYRERVIVTHPVKHTQIDLVGKQRIADAVAVERLRRQAHFRSALLKTLQHRGILRQQRFASGDAKFAAGLIVGVPPDESRPSL